MFAQSTEFSELERKEVFIRPAAFILQGTQAGNIHSYRRGLNEVFKIPLTNNRIFLWQVFTVLLANILANKV